MFKQWWKKTLSARSPSVSQHDPTALLLGVIFVEAAAVIVLEALIVQYHVSYISSCILSTIELGASEADLILHGLMMATQIYQVLICIDAVKHRITAQLYALILFGLLTVISVCLQTQQHINREDGLQECPRGSSTTLPTESISDHVQKIRPFEYAVIGVTPLCFLVFVVCAIRLRKSFAWENYNRTASDFRARHALLALSTCTSLLKLAFFYVFAYAIQLVPSGLLHYSITPLEIMLVLGLPALGFLFAWHAVGQERVFPFCLVAVFCFVCIGYYVFRLVTFAMPPQPTFSTQDPYKFVRYYLVFTNLVIILLMSLILCVVLVCIRNIMRGITVLSAQHGHQSILPQPNQNPSENHKNIHDADTEQQDQVSLYHEAKENKSLVDYTDSLLQLPKDDNTVVHV
ncbi:uncharacterized protein BYT42DRAFT_181445 [Radiomyces spectabilis]|uniref:uncharacterized protein n=1 Tax=Radiomyces spectabilis TaxID=64574 RepID=UPI002220F76F|nr:uncharacterized protein BYT42DRAFT_181445 [Radiomyces spectabilis]KAI8391092.1 hypothetical protein BYT42DRAFT_181445 [Radiomyces spectabilis]